MAGAGLDRASRGAKAGIALTFPALVVLALTMLYPIGRTVWLSLNSDKTALRGGVDFVGLANYVKIIRNPDFAVALAQTLGFLAASFAVEAAVRIEGRTRSPSRSCRRQTSGPSSVCRSWSRPWSARWPGGSCSPAAMA